MTYIYRTPVFTVVLCRGPGSLIAWGLACGCSVRGALIIGNNHMGSKTVMQWRKRLALYPSSICDWTANAIWHCKHADQAEVTILQRLSQTISLLHSEATARC